MPKPDVSVYAFGNCSRGDKRHAAPILTAGVTTLLLIGLSRLIGRGKPLLLTADQGAIRPERVSAWLTVIVGTAMCVSGLIALFASPIGWTAAVLAAMGAAIAGFMAPSLTSVHVVYWNSEGIEGPSNLFGPTLGLRRTQIAWPEIVKMGKTFTSYWFVESQDGRRIYWSYLYKGYSVLTQALEAHCPNVEVPPEMQ